MISNANSFGFILNLPYELHKYVVANKAVDVAIPPDRRTRLDEGQVLFMPIIDSVSQTQQVLIKVSNSPSRIPETPIAKVRILKNSKDKYNIAAQAGGIE